MTLRKEYVEAIAEVSRVENPLDRVNALATKLLRIDNPRYAEGEHLPLLASTTS